VEPPIPLPDGTVVEVTVASNSITEDSTQTLHDRLKSVIGVVEDMPEDASVNIDHYLYGHPKK
jgi:hypothetical protein